MKRLIDTKDIDFIKSIQKVLDISGQDLDLKNHDIKNVVNIESENWNIDSDGWLSSKEAELKITSSAGEDYKMSLQFDEDVESETSTEYKLKPDGIYLNGNKIGEYTAGDNITITDENVISATDTTYTAGAGIDITDGVISTAGGTTKYKHNIELLNHNTLYSSTMYCAFSFENTVSTAYTSIADVISAIYSEGFTSENKCLQASGVTSDAAPIVGVYAANSASNGLRAIYRGSSTMQEASGGWYSVFKGDVVE